MGSSDRGDCQDRDDDDRDDDRDHDGRGPKHLSFSKHPQAQNDLFTPAGLVDHHLGSVILDVLANDRRTAAPSLYSLDNGDRIDDLLRRDSARSEAASSDRSAHGATLWITASGKVGYDASTLSGDFKEDLRELGQGEYLEDTFVYAIQVDEHTLSWARVTVRIGGVNDAPVISSASQTTGTVQEDLKLSVKGEIKASDVDHGDHLRYTIAGSATGTYGSLSIDPRTGKWTYTLNNAAANLQALGADDTREESFTIRVLDDHGAYADKTVRVTVRGTNDAPVAAADSYVADEDHVLAVSASRGVLANDSDIDHDALRVVSTGTFTTALGARVTLAADGSFSYDPRNAATLQALNNGQSAVDRFTYTVSDGHGGTATASTSITVTGITDGGTNRPPVAVDDALTTNEDVVLRVAATTLLANDTDPDAGDTKTLVSVQGALHGAVAISGSQVVFTPERDYFGPASFTYTMQDRAGARSTATVNVAVNSVNDAAILSSDTRVLTETNSAADISATGRLTITDIDSSATFNTQTNTAGTYGKFSIAADGNWSYVADSAHDEFVQGTTYTDLFDVTSADGTHTSVTLQIRGTDDAAVLSVPPVASSLDIVVANANDGVGVLAGDGRGSFAAPVNVPTGASSPFSVALGDVNRDGELDIVTANFGSGDVSVLLGDGFGRFQSAGVFSTGASNPRAAALADVNGDGRLDIVTANSDVTNSVSVLLNDGGGGFAPALFDSGGANPIAVAMGDVDGDSQPDIVVANSDGDSVGILTGDGLGGFSAPAVLASGGSKPSSVALGDVDGDGDLDIVVANLSGDIGILIAQGDGSFAPPATVSLGSGGANAVALGDLDADGILDIAVANGTSGEVRLLFGEGSGNFSLSPTALSSGGTSPTSLAVGDLNADGRLDIVVTNADSANLGVLLGTGAGSFAAPSSYASGGSSPVAVALANVVDAVSLGYTENQAATAISAALRLTDVDSTTVSGATVAIGTGFHAGQDVLGFVNTTRITGTYNATTGVLTLTGTDTLAAYQAALRSVTYFNSSQDPSDDTRSIVYHVGAASLTVHVSVTPVNDPAQLSSATVNLAETDAAASLSASGTLTISDLDSPATFVAQSDTAGIYGTFSIDDAGAWTYTAFSAHDEFVAGLTYTETFEVMSADGTTTSVTLHLLGTNDAPRLLAPSLSIVTVNQGSDDVTVIAGDGAGNFLPPVSTASGGTEPRSAAFGDLNGDGKLDLVVANHSSNTLGILLGNGAGDFSLAGTLPTAFAYAVHVGDVTGDAKLDILVSNLEDSTISVFIGDGAGAFTAAPAVPTGGNYPYSFALGDVNGDSKPDLVVGNWINNVAVFAGDGAGNFTAAGSFAEGSAPYSVALGDVNGDGPLDIVVAQTVDNSVGVLLGDGSGGFTFAGAFATGGSFPYALRLADFNGDHRLDVAVANGATSTVGVLLGDGTGGFSDAVAYDSGGGSPTSLDVGDVSGDGRLDILVGNFDSSNVGVLLGDGSGGFATAITVATNGNPNAVLLADVAGATSLTYPSTHSPMAINGALRIDDVDSATLTSARVSITGNFHAGQDVLAFTDTATLHAAYNAGTGVLTLTGTDTVATYQAALRSVTYFNSSDAPLTDTRIVSFQVDDGAALRHASNVVTSSVVVQAGVALIGGSGAESLIGSAAGDTLTGNGGNDLLTGLGGADRFVYHTLGDALDTITDFHRAEGDKLDIRDVLAGYGGTPVLGNFVDLVAAGGDTTLRVNADGIGLDFEPLVTLQGVTGLLSPLELLTGGNLIVS